MEVRVVSLAEILPFFSKWKEPGCSRAFPGMPESARMRSGSLSGLLDSWSDSLFLSDQNHQQTQILRGRVQENKMFEFKLNAADLSGIF